MHPKIYRILNPLQTVVVHGVRRQTSSADYALHEQLATLLASTA